MESVTEPQLELINHIKEVHRAEALAESNMLLIMKMTQMATIEAWLQTRKTADLTERLNLFNMGSISKVKMCLKWFTRMISTLEVLEAMHICQKLTLCPWLQVHSISKFNSLER